MTVEIAKQKDSVDEQFESEVMEESVGTGDGDTSRPASVDKASSATEVAAQFSPTIPVQASE